MVEWPAEEGALYTLVLSNLDINTRENRFPFKISHLVKPANQYISVFLRSRNQHTGEQMLTITSLSST